jgi:hypothetical protein
MSLVRFALLIALGLSLPATMVACKGDETDSEAAE